MPQVFLKDIGDLIFRFPGKMQKKDVPGKVTAKKKNYFVSIIRSDFVHYNSARFYYFYFLQIIVTVSNF